MTPKINFQFISNAFNFRSISSPGLDENGRDDASRSPSGRVPVVEKTRTLLFSRDPVAGYGLTLSGDQPVFVQTVKPGGAADRAGVKENDVIVMVNGRSVVTEASHSEVVAMIQGRKKLFCSWNQLQCNKTC